MKIHKDIRAHADQRIGEAWGADSTTVLENMLKYADAMLLLSSAERMQIAGRTQTPTMFELIHFTPDLATPEAVTVQTIAVFQPTDPVPSVEPIAVTTEIFQPSIPFTPTDDGGWLAATAHLSFELSRFSTYDLHIVEDNLVQRGLLCSVCSQAQFRTPSGISCLNGHGGAEGYVADEALAILPPLPPLPVPPGASPPFPPEPASGVHSILTPEQLQKKPYIDAGIRDGIITHATVAAKGTTNAWLELNLKAPKGWFAKTDAVLLELAAAIPASNRMITCPFHDDPKPSMKIYPDGNYLCFFCKNTGAIADSPQVRAAAIKNNVRAGGALHEIGLNDAVNALDRLGYHLTLPIYASLDPTERTAITDWLQQGADPKTIPRILLSEIERGEMLPPCPTCKKRGVKRVGPNGMNSHLCSLCNKTFEVDGLAMKKKASKEEEGPVGAGCAACEQGKPFLNGTEYLHTGLGPVCTVTPSAGANGASEPEPEVPASGKKSRICGNCKESGHNARTCQRPKANVEPVAAAPTTTIEEATAHRKMDVHSVEGRIHDRWAAAALRARAYVQQEDEVQP